MNSSTRFRRPALAATLVVLSFLVIRVLGAPGDLDTTFNSTGKVTTAVGIADDFANALAVQPDGKIVLAGHSFNNVTNYDFALVRYNSNGALDTGFDTDGKVTTALGISVDQAYAVVIQPDGKIVVAGTTLNGSNTDFALARYNPNGSLDITFNSTGKVTTAVGSSDDEARAVALQPDGKIVVAGYSYNGANYDFAVARYNSNGILDTSFDTDGKVTTAVGSNYDFARAVALQPDGKIVVAGYSLVTNSDVAVVRYNTDGALDTSFDTDGKVTTDVSGDDFGNAVALQPDGKIVVAGTGNNSPDSDFALVRYNADGTRDTTFNFTGVVTTPVGSGSDEARAVAIQPDGKILAAGTGIAIGTFDFAVVCYNTDGTLDTTFNGTGKVTTAIGSGVDQAQAVAVQPDGKVVAAGYSYNGSNYDFAAVRYQSFNSLNRISNFDGDRKTDVAVWNPTNRNWYIIYSSTGQLTFHIDWGSGDLGDKAVPADYDGDGKTDIAVWRPSEGNWYIIQSSNAAPVVKNWGAQTDTPLIGDFDGDGKADIAVWRPSEGNWYIKNSRDNSVTLRAWGAATDKPAPADYDGDGRTDIAVYRPSEGNWYIITSGDGLPRIQQWGIATDKLVPTDYDGDGRADVAIYRAGTWYIRYWTNATTVKGWGDSNDTPVPGDYDGDGKADIAVFRSSEGNWYILNSSTNAASVIYLGGDGDVPVPSAYLPQ
ncbi:MAG TPA: FG-GAP-like repeat-containing protein [Pyrinomonadaceae bacterium]|jgi:uncharacterized delta-60 repeat protein